MSQKSYSLSEVSQILDAELRGDPHRVITGIAPLNTASSEQISFINNPHYKKFLTTTQAAAIILEDKYVDNCQTNVLVMKNPSLGYAKAAALFETKFAVKPAIHSSAVIGTNTHIAATASIGANCVIGDDVTIGEHTVIHPGCVIGHHVTIGDHGLLWSNVTLYHQVTIGNNAIIHSGAVIGSDGFGMVNDKGTWHKIPQIGGVLIGNDVEIGANTCIDRGALENTVIEDGVKLDNQIQIAHNVHIGAHTVIAGCTAIAGSTRIGKYCMIGGAASINGHIEITDGVILAGAAMIASSIHEAGAYSSGLMAQPIKEWRKNAIRFLHLDALVRRVQKLEKNTT